MASPVLYDILGETPVRAKVTFQGREVPDAIDLCEELLGTPEGKTLLLREAAWGRETVGVTKVWLRDEEGNLEREPIAVIEDYEDAWRR